MNELEFEEGEWQAVQIGPETVGWLGPHLPLEQDYLQAEIRVLIGERTIDLNVFALSLALIGGRAFEDMKIVTRMIDYHRRFAIRVPVGSLDSEPGSVIVYSPRTLETLHTVLNKLFVAVSFIVQADLHKCKTPVEVVRKCAELDAYGYPYVLWKQFMWRGILLDNLLRNTEMKVRVLNNDPTSTEDNPYDNNLERITRLPKASHFGSFVSWQTRNGYDISRTVPENVFLIRTSSQEEYEEGRQLLQDDASLINFLTSTEGEEIKDATFFMCPAGNPLEEWVDGKVLTVEDFNATKGTDIKKESEYEA